MRLPKLYQRLFLSPEPGDTSGTGTGADPVVDTPAPPPAADSPAPTPAPTEPPAPDLSTTIGDMLAKVGKPEDDTPSPTPAPTPAPVAGKAPAATPAPKADDDLTPPDGLNERAQQRFTALAERVKAVPELERRATEAESQLGKVREMVNASGLQPNEFTDMLETGRLLKSSKPADLQAALDRIDSIRTDIAVRLGKDVPGTDPLAAHPDLKADVDAMALTRERALEIVKLRGKGAAADTMTADQQEIQQYQQTVQKAATTMESALRARATEPGHESKVKTIGAYFADPAKLQAFVSTYQPTQWQAALMLMYDNMGVQAPPPPAPPSGPQPLRPNNVRTGAPVRNGLVTAESAVEDAFKTIGM